MKKILLLLILFILVKQNQAQLIYTIAGTGFEGYSGDSALAVNAKLDSPTDVAVDNDGNVYVSDYGNNRIRKIDLSGIITTIAGNGTPGFSGDGGPAIAAQIDLPAGIALDSIGNIYFLDANNQRIRKINTAGIITTIAGNGLVGYTGDGDSATAASLSVGAGIACDKTGNIFIADFGNQVIRKVNTAGIISTVAGNGVVGYSGDSGPATDAELNYPRWVGVDNHGNIFVSDMSNNVIRKVNSSGTISRFAGSAVGSPGFDGDGGPATDALFFQPQDVEIDVWGNVYISDTNDRIRIVDTLGTITTYAGNGTLGSTGDGGLATYANIGCRAGIAVDKNSNLYIAEPYTHKIRKVNAMGVGIKEEALNDKSASIYPNPFSSQTTIAFSNEQNHTSIKITDVLGNEIKQMDFTGKQFNLEKEELKTGIYFVQITDERKNSIIKKIIIQ